MYLIFIKQKKLKYFLFMQISLKKRTEKDAQKASLLLDEKLQIQANLLQIVEQHQQRLFKEVYKPLDLEIEENYSIEGPFGDISEAQLHTFNPSLPMIQAQSNTLNASSSGSLSISSNEEIYHQGSNFKNLQSKSAVSVSPRPPLLTLSTEQNYPTAAGILKVSPRKRVSLNDEPPIDPNEPVYCYCKQVSWGEMVACDSSKCSREWFHLACVNLISPPQGKWFCKECLENKK